MVYKLLRLKLLSHYVTGEKHQPITIQHVRDLMMINYTSHHFTYLLTCLISFFLLFFLSFLLTYLLSYSLTLWCVAGLWSTQSMVSTPITSLSSLMSSTSMYDCRLFTSTSSLRQVYLPTVVSALTIVMHCNAHVIHTYVEVVLVSTLSVWLAQSDELNCSPIRYSLLHYRWQWPLPVFIIPAQRGYPGYDVLSTHITLLINTLMLSMRTA